MGFGGFFDYDKVGPGVSKNQPKKRSFFAFFDIWFRNFWALIPVSLVYSLFSLLIIPSGLAEAGITNVTRNMSRDKHSFGVSDFFTTIKKNWKQALPAGIINFLATWLMILAMWFYLSNKGVFSIIGFGLVFACFIIFSFMKYYIWLMLITFKLPLGKIYKNSFVFAFANIKKNILIGLVWLVCCAVLVASVVLVGYNIVWLIVLFLALAVLPGFINLMTQFTVFPIVKKFMLDPYYAEHKGEDIELRRSLGLEIPEDEEEEESVFDDNRFFGEAKDE